MSTHLGTACHMPVFLQSLSLDKVLCFQPYQPPTPRPAWGLYVLCPPGGIPPLDSDPKLKFPTPPNTTGCLRTKHSLTNCQGRGPRLYHNSTHTAAWGLLLSTFFSNSWELVMRTLQLYRSLPGLKTFNSPELSWDLLPLSHYINTDLLQDWVKSPFDLIYKVMNWDMMKIQTYTQQRKARFLYQETTVKHHIPTA